MGMLSEAQASLDAKDNGLIMDAWFCLGQARGQTDQETIKLQDLKVLLLAVLRLNDGKHFSFVESPPKRADRVYGQVQDGVYVMNQDDMKTIKKAFEPLYANHLQFMGKVIEAQKQQKVLEAENQAKVAVVPLSKTSLELAEKYRQRENQQPPVNSPEWIEEAARQQAERELKDCTFQP